MVPPDEFIPLAEEIGMIVPIGEWVLRTACRDAVGLHDGGYPLHLSVNLSMQQFRDPDLVGRIAGILAETGLEPEWLELELTETIIMTEATQSIAALEPDQAPGRRAVDRRFRHRLFQPQLPDEAADRHAEDRPKLHPALRT